jgi:hypothetical protein
MVGPCARGLSTARQAAWREVISNPYADSVDAALRSSSRSGEAHGFRPSLSKRILEDLTTTTSRPTCSSAGREQLDTAIIAVDCIATNGAVPGPTVKVWLLKPTKSYSARADQGPVKGPLDANARGPARIDAVARDGEYHSARRG